MADGFDVDAATGDVGGDQYADLAFAEAFQNLDALVLRHVAGHLRGADAVLGQAFLDAADFVLAVGEDHHTGPVVLRDQVVQQLVLVAAGHGVDVLLDGVAGDVLRLDLDDGRFDGPLLGEVHHVTGEGRGEQQGLALALVRGLADDLADLRDEAHVEHTVGFVEHHHLDHVQVHLATLVEVQQTAGGGDQDVAEARFEGAQLLVEVHAADEAHHVQPGVLGQAHGVLGDLHHQLAGRRDDQRARLAHVALFRRRGLQQLGDDRDEERGGLAGAGLGAADGVLALEGVAEHLRLDRRAVGEAEVVDGVHQPRVELEVVEAGLAFLRLDDEVFQLPVIHNRSLRRTFAARLFAARFVVGLVGGFLGARLGGLGRTRSLFGGFAFRAGIARLARAFFAAGCGWFCDGSRGGGGGGRLLAFALAEDFLECFEHGDLVLVKE
ncbi:hypothetical protein D3C78_742530 [compost metagenome]